jgi:hypothetical protein
LRRANNPFPRGTAILIICISAWLMCGVFYYITSYFITEVIDSLRNEMKHRAAKA